MTKLNNKLIISIILAFAVIFASVFAIVYTMQDINNVSLETEGTSTSSLADVKAGYNGVVADDYTTSYTSGTVYTINSESTLSTFLTAAASASSSSLVYGVMTSDVTYTGTLSANVFQYAYLDGCGHTITITDTSNTYTYMDSSYVCNYITYIASYATPFGYYSSKKYFYCAGYMGAIGLNSSIINTNFVYSGSFSHTSSGENRPLSLGLIFGYAWGTTIDNCSLTLSSNSSVYFSNYVNTHSDADSLGTHCQGGYVGVLDGYNDNISTISNSSIDLKAGSSMTGLSKGMSAVTDVQSPRVFVGGMAGVLCNSAQIYNVSAYGSGTLTANPNKPSYNSGNDLIGLSGIIVGSNATTNSHLYSAHENASTVVSGTIDNVYCCWTGTATQEIGARFATSGNAGAIFSYITTAGSYAFGGTIVGYGVTSALTNVYYGYTKDYMLTATGVTENYFYAIAMDGVTASASYLDRYIYDNSDAAYESITTTEETELSLIWQYNSSTSVYDAIIYADATETSDYTDDSGLFIWDFSLTSSSVTNDTVDLCATATSVQDAIENYTQYASSTVLTHGGVLDATITAKVRFGYAAYYQLDSAGSYNLNLGSKTYNATADTSAPSLYLYTYNKSTGTNNVVLNYLGSSSNITEGTYTILNYSSVWTVNTGTSSSITDYTEYKMSNIKNAGYYYLYVYDSTINSSYAFLDDDDAIVAYNSDVTSDLTKVWTSPYYTYTVEQKVVTGAWGTVSNIILDDDMEAVTYTSPKNFVYSGVYADFSFNYVSGWCSGETSTIKTTYHSAVITAVDASDLVADTEYYSLVDDVYTYVGTTSDFTATLDTYYTVTYSSTKLGGIKNAGDYVVEITDVTNTNYTILSNTFTQLIYPVTVSPREIVVEYSGLSDLEYNEQEQKATYYIANRKDESATYTTYDETLTQDSYIKYSALDSTVTVSNANVLVYNIVDSTAVTVTYNNSNDYESVGTYELYITLGSGARTNYTISTTIPSGADSSNHIFTTDANNIIYMITRIVTIGKASVELVRQADSSTVTNGYRNADDSLWYASYEEIASAGITSYPEVTVDFNGTTVTCYYDYGTYIGYNAVPSILKGVTTSEGLFSQVYSDAVYYNATKVSEGNYSVTDVDTTYADIVQDTGLYFVAITFDSEFYSNYEEETFYMIYEVQKVALTVTVDTSYEGQTYEYSGQDMVDTLNTNVLAEISGFTSTTERKKTKITYVYYQVVDGVNVAVNEVVNAGDYIVLITNNIDTNNYSFTYTPADGTSTINYVTYNGDSVPYVSFTITPISITLKTINTEDVINTKVYGTEFTSAEVGYEIVSGEFVGEEESTDIIFASTGFASSANVGEYSITATSASGNYVFTMDANSVEITVTKLDIIFVVSDSNGDDASKVYGETFDATALVLTVKTGYSIYGEDDISATVDSEGFNAESIVSAEGYSYTAQASGSATGNYNVSVEGTFYITQKELTLDSITVQTDLVYSSSEKEVTGVFDGIVNSDEVNATIAIYKLVNDAYVAVDLAVDVGNYRVLVTGVDNANYSYVENEDGYDLEFTITAREVEVSIYDFTMGYGDVSLTVDKSSDESDPKKGFAYISGSLEFVDDDALTFTFIVIDDEYLTREPSDTAIDDAVTMTISGDKASNYTLTVSSFGSLTIEGKNVSELTLSTESLVYTGENLIDSIVFATNADSSNWVLTVYSDEARENEITEIVNVGTYYLTVTATEGSTVFTGTNETLTFEVTKGEFDVTQLTLSELIIHYNSIEVSGLFDNYTILVGTSEDSLVEAREVTGLSATTYTRIYVQVVNDDNYNDSAIMSIRVRTSYDPNAINTALNRLGTKFGFADISTYKSIMANYESVSEADIDLVDSAALTKATTRYNTLINSATVVVNTARSAAAMTAQVSYTIAAASVSSLGLIAAGLMIGLKRKKKNNKDAQ